MNIASFGNLTKALYTLGIISWFTTGLGLYGAGSNWFVAMLISGIVQMFLVGSVYLFFSSGKMRYKMLSPVVYFLTVPVSIIFSVAFWFQLFGAQDYADEIFTKQFDKVFIQANKLEMAYKSELDSLVHLSETAKQMAAKEFKQGGTCIGGSLPGEGPRYAKRVMQAEVFSSLAVPVRRDFSGMKAAVSAMEQIRASKEPLNAKLKSLKISLSNIEAKYAARDLSYRQVLTKHLNWEINGYPPAKKAGKFDISGLQYACNTPSLTAPIEMLLNAKPKPIPPIEVELFNPADRKQTVKKIVDGFWQLFTPGSPPSLFSKDYMHLPLMLGLLVDLMILLGGLLIRPAENSIGRMWEIFSAFHHCARLHPDAIETRPAEMMRKGSIMMVGESARFVDLIVQQYSLTAGNERYIIISNSNDSQVKAFLEDLVESLFSKEIVDEVTHTKNKYLLNEIEEETGLVPSDSAWCSELNIYRVSAELDSLIHTHAAYPRSYYQVPGWLYASHGELNQCHWESLHEQAQMDLMGAYVRDNRTDVALENGTILHRLLLSTDDPFQKKISQWLNEDDHGLAPDHVRRASFDLGPMTFSKLLWWEILEIDHDGYRKILTYSSSESAA